MVVLGPHKAGRGYLTVQKRAQMTLRKAPYGPLVGTETSVSQFSNLICGRIDALHRKLQVTSRTP